MKIRLHGILAAIIFLAPGFAGSASAQASPASIAAHLVTHKGDLIVHNFHFQSGQTLPDLRLHYTTLGSPHRDASGRVANAVLFLHGTGGSGRQFLREQFAGVLFGPGEQQPAP